MPHHTRCRIKVEFFSGSKEISASLKSQNLINEKQNDVGSFELHDISDPKSCCTKGGFKIILSSKYKLPTFNGNKGNKIPPIQALFVLKMESGKQFLFNQTPVHI